MSYKTSNLIIVKEAVKKILKSASLGKKIYPFVQKAYKIYATPMKRHRLRKHGAAALSRVIKVLRENDIEFYCDYGTLLGFIRDHGFISHDDDIDITIMPDTIQSKDLLKILINAGFGFIHGFNYKGKLIEFTIADLSQVTIDFFFPVRNKKEKEIFETLVPDWSPMRKYPTEKANDVLLTPYIGAKEIQDYSVLGIDVKIPVNYEEVLTSEYGEWKIPDPKYDYREDKRIGRVDGFAFRLTKEEALSL